MVLHVHAKCAKLHSDILDSALHGWIFLGVFCGCNLIEWAHNCADEKMSLVNMDGLPIAFTFEDLIFYGAQKHDLCQSWSTELDTSKIAFV